MEVAFGEGKVMNEKDLNTWKRLYEAANLLKAQKP
ncbi:hypothetical protein T472_0204125 [Youngiibacter fragilis 232.1]|uniref:Uncharacterized protein n=1 Tax=Youngiibacter fragilis 232.1 TaxID=994573 RepID=V7I994_9CLOT|nr:hypothetical protein T472_0204125 [Youngiibacter fragilis 232.1]